MAREPWDVIGEDQPYYGVCTADQYRGKTALDPETADAFYDSGRRYVQGVCQRFARHFEAGPSSGTALDVGCGVGRLTLAMPAHCDRVVGYDVAPSMLERAREAAERSPHRERLRFVEALPEGPFDWVLSFIVFQHIAPDKGMALLDQVLSRLAPRAFVSLHFTTWRDEVHRPPTGLRGLARRAALDRLRGRAMRGEGPTHALISMYDYDLTALTQRFVEAGCRELVMRHTNHSGHHGVEIMARRSG